jgi:DUF1707 SHOCT-like domain/Cell wall-active antibiotics response LiaF, C-terminal
VDEAHDELALRRRVSDIEREDVAEVLREAAGEGRLSYIELEDRLEQAYGAKTYGELVKVTADLPNGLAQSAAAVPAVKPASRQIRVVLSESKRTGPWLASQHTDVSAVLGDVVLDYSEAQIPFQEVYVDVSAVLADVTIRVPDDAVVDLDGQPILGSIKEQGRRGTPAADNGQPTRVFRIRARAVLADVKVKRGRSFSRRHLGR